MWLAAQACRPAGLLKTYHILPCALNVLPSGLTNGYSALAAGCLAPCTPPAAADLPAIRRFDFLPQLGLRKSSNALGALSNFK